MTRQMDFWLLFVLEPESYSGRAISQEFRISW